MTAETTLHVEIRLQNEELRRQFIGRTLDDLSQTLAEMWTEHFGSPGRGKHWTVGAIEHFAGGSTYHVQMGYRFGNAMTLEPTVVVKARES